MTDHERARLEALGYFLVKEIKRHQKDIYRAFDDLQKLANKGIRIPDFHDVDADEWIEP